MLTASRSPPMEWADPAMTGVCSSRVRRSATVAALLVTIASAAAGCLQPTGGPASAGVGRSGMLSSVRSSSFRRAAAISAIVLAVLVAVGVTMAATSSGTGVSTDYGGPLGSNPHGLGHTANSDMSVPPAAPAPSSSAGSSSTGSGGSASAGASGGASAGSADTSTGSASSDGSAASAGSASGTGGSGSGASSAATGAAPSSGG